MKKYESPDFDVVLFNTNEIVLEDDVTQVVTPSGEDWGPPM